MCIRDRPGTVPSGAPFPFAGVSNVPGFTISTKAPVETAAPKTNVGVPYARNVPSVFAQEPKNLVTACAGDPVFVSNKTPMLRGDTNRFTYSCTVEYLNEKLAGQDNRIAAGAAWGLDEVVLATQPIMLLRNFMQYVPTVGYRVLNKVGPKRTRAARAGASMYELK